jgi:hypothetical protein
MVGAAMEEAGVELVELRCLVIPEAVFNETVRSVGSKAAATVLAVGEHLRRITAIRHDGPVRIVCDRLGGRALYRDTLAAELTGADVSVVEESDRVSRYEVGGPGCAVQFEVEAESSHMPVALASMAAKLVRELAMARFNRYWCGRCPELKPTAGYSQDARRWLGDAAPLLTDDDRAALVRIA